MIWALNTRPCWTPLHTHPLVLTHKANKENQCKSSHAQNWPGLSWLLLNSFLTSNISYNYTLKCSSEYSKLNEYSHKADTFCNFARLQSLYPVHSILKDTTLQSPHVTFILRKSKIKTPASTWYRQQWGGKTPKNQFHKPYSLPLGNFHNLYCSWRIPV